MNATLFMVLGLLALVVGAIGLAYRRGTKLADKKLVEKHEAEKDAARKALRDKAIEGQDIQTEVHELPIEEVMARLRKRAKK